MKDFYGSEQQVGIVTPKNTTPIQTPSATVTTSNSTPSLTVIEAQRLLQQWGLKILPELGVMVCFVCRYGVMQANIPAHFNYMHERQISSESLQEVLDALKISPVKDLGDSRISHLYDHKQKPKEIKELALYEGYQCSQCHFCCISFDTIALHKQTHPLIGDKVVPHYKCPVQTIFQHREYLRYFAVKRNFSKTLIYINLIRRKRLLHSHA